MEWSDPTPVSTPPSATLAQALAAAHGDATTWAKSLTPLLREKLARAIADDEVSASDMIKLSTLLDDRVDGKVVDRQVQTSISITHNQIVTDKVLRLLPQHELERLLGYAPQQTQEPLQTQHQTQQPTQTEQIEEAEFIEVVSLDA